MSPLNSDLPILRYIFVHHVREFPFLDKAREKEFWQDKLQTVSFGGKIENIRYGSVTNGSFCAVSRIICEETHLILGRSARRNEAEEAFFEMSEIGGAYDGFWSPNGIRIRRKNKIF